MTNINGCTCFNQFLLIVRRTAVIAKDEDHTPQLTQKMCFFFQNGEF
jgi:hypothetical protein